MVAVMTALLGGLGLWMAWFHAVESPATPDAIGRGAWALIAAIAVWAALFGAGRWIRFLVGHAGWRTEPTPIDRLHDLAGGVALGSVLLLVLAAVGALGTVSAAALTAVGIAGLALPPRSPSPAPTRWEPALAVGAILLLAPLALVALAPPTETDELYYQLAVPAQILRENGLPGGWLDPVASRPLPIQLLFTALLALGGEAAPKVFHLVGAGVLVTALYAVVRDHASDMGSDKAAVGGLWACALLAGSWTFLDEAPLAHDNVPTALLILAGLDAALRGRTHRGWLVVALGAAIAAKYTAAPAVAATAVVYAWVRATDPDRGKPLVATARVFAETGALLSLAAIVVAPWWIRNIVSGLHPLFPYAGWPAVGDFTYVYPQKYGVGRDLWALLKLPWNLVVEAETTSYAFLGRLHPAWVLFVPGLVWAWVRQPKTRPLVLASVVGVVGWFVGAQWMRHLLPVAPVVGVAMGVAFASQPVAVQRIAFVVWAVLLPPQVMDTWSRGGEARGVATGEVGREAWIEQQVRTAEAFRWVDEHTPRDATIAALFVGQRYLANRTVLLGSVEDHTPVRHLVVVHGDDSLQVLRDAGVDYVVAYPYRFLRKSYPFVDTETFRTQFTEPTEQLTDLLAREATLLFESGRTGVWALDDGNPDG